MRKENTAERAAEAACSITCSVREFAEIVGVSRDCAYELVNSSCPPPGFKVGKGYRVITARIPEYLDALYERELEERAARRGRIAM